VATAAASSQPTDTLIGRTAKAKAVDPRARIGHANDIRAEHFGNKGPIREAGEAGMTTFDDRERSFEKKFALDEELKFKSEQRRNKLLGEWAAGRLGLTGPAVEEYVRAVRKADLASKGDEDVFQKVRTDFDAKQVAVSDAELRRAMADFLAAAMDQIEGERKGT
jgi:hypothetical protein